MNDTDRCDGCRAHIVWATTSHGHRVAVDARPNRHGTLIFTGPRTVLAVNPKQMPASTRWRPHHCPAAAWRGIHRETAAL